MSIVALPAIPVASRSRPRRNLLVWIGLPALAVILAGGLIWWLVARGVATTITNSFHTVNPLNLEIKVAKDGELQAVNNIDIYCQVEGSTTITQIVKEGASVKKGDVLIVLDSSQITVKLEDSQRAVLKATADFTTAKEMKDIQLSQNAANQEAADVAVILAKLDLQQYSEGTYPQQLANAKTDKEMAETTLKNRQADLEQTKALAIKGFVTDADVQKSQLDVITAQNAVAKATTSLSVLTTYTYQMDITSKRNAVAQTAARLERTKRENVSQMAQKEADLQAKEQDLAIQKRRLEKLQKDRVNCTINAPADGLVVYGTTGDRNREPIQEGSTVRERQLLIRLPDTESMKAVVRIQEAQINKLKVDQRATVLVAGLQRPIPATLTRISVLSDSSQRWWNPDLKEYPVELVLDETPKTIKPGASVQVEIMVDTIPDTLAVPHACIYAVGADSYVFVREDTGLKPAKVRLGQSNETHAEIKEGLTAGQDVAILQAGQGRILLEKAGIKIAPTTRPGGGRNRPPRNGGARPPAETPAPAAPATPAVVTPK